MPGSALGSCMCLMAATHPVVSEQLKEPLGKELSDSRAGLKGFPSFSPFLLRRSQAGRLGEALAFNESLWP